MVRKMEFNTVQGRRQAAVYSKYSITNHDANRNGLARWYEKMRNGAWEHQNYVDNFGESNERNGTV